MKNLIRYVSTEYSVKLSRNAKFLLKRVLEY